MLFYVYTFDFLRHLLLRRVHEKSRQSWFTCGEVSKLWSFIPLLFSQEWRPFKSSKLFLLKKRPNIIPWLEKLLLLSICQYVSTILTTSIWMQRIKRVDRLYIGGYHLTTSTTVANAIEELGNHIREGWPFVVGKSKQCLVWNNDWVWSPNSLDTRRKKG